MSEHAKVRCNQCHPKDHPGDDHPKFHYGAETWHHDCAPQYAIDDAIGGGHSVDAETTAAVFKASREDGLKGDELRAHILTLHADAPAKQQARLDAEQKALGEWHAEQAAAHLDAAAKIQGA